MLEKHSSGAAHVYLALVRFFRSRAAPDPDTEAGRCLRRCAPAEPAGAGDLWREALQAARATGAPDGERPLPAAARLCGASFRSLGAKEREFLFYYLQYPQGGAPPAECGPVEGRLRFRALLRAMFGRPELPEGAETKRTGAHELTMPMTSDTPTSDAFLRAYLFARCAPEEAARLEEQYFRDPQVFEELDSLECEILRDFVRNSLPADEHSWIDARRASDPLLDNRIRDIESLVTATADLAAEIGRRLEAFYYPIQRYFQRRNPKHSEEGVQETMLRAFRLLIRQDVDDEGLPPFLFRIASFVAKEAWRERLLPVGDAGELERHMPRVTARRKWPQPDSAIYRRQLLDIIHGVLTPSDRELLYRYYTTTNRELLAESLGILPSNLRLRAFRLRQKVQQALEKRLGPGWEKADVD